MLDGFEFIIAWLKNVTGLQQEAFSLTKAAPLQAAATAGSENLTIAFSKAISSHTPEARPLDFHLFFSPPARNYVTLSLEGDLRIHLPLGAVRPVIHVEEGRTVVIRCQRIVCSHRHVNAGQDYP